MANDKIGQIIQLLIDKTGEEKIAWTATDTPNIFQVSFANSSLQIFPKSINGRPFMVVRMFNEEGELIEEVNDEQLFMGNAYDTLASLHTAARRKAMGVDDALNAILGELSNK